MDRNELFTIVDDLCEEYAQKLIDEMYSIPIANVDQLIHVIRCHCFNDLRSDLIKTLEEKINENKVEN